MLIDYLQPRIVGDIRPSAVAVRVGSVTDAVNIEIFLVPLDYFVVRAELPPARNAFTHLGRQRIAAEPAIVNFFRYHRSLPL